MKKRGKNLSYKTRAAIRRMKREGLSATAICKKTGAVYSSVLYWTRPTARERIKASSLESQRKLRRNYRAIEELREITDKNKLDAERSIFSRAASFILGLL